MIFIIIIVMNLSYRRIIHKVIKEEIMSENAIARLLEWYRNWNDKLSQSISEGDYAKIIDTHFKTGVYLLSALKNASKSPELREVVKEELDMVRTKMIIIQKARKSFDSMK
jgi:sulfur relay (sulfurtransferase) DsrC/TusE family protein